MANGNAHDRIAERLEGLERRIEDRSARRDQEATEIREAIADAIARLGSLEGNCAETRSAVVGLQAVKPPGFLALAGPAIAAAVMVGSLGGFVLSEAIGPVKERLHVLATIVELVRDRQDDVRQRLSRTEGRLNEIDERVEAIDAHGPRVRLE